MVQGVDGKLGLYPRDRNGEEEAIKMGYFKQKLINTFFPKKAGLIKLPTTPHKELILASAHEKCTLFPSFNKSSANREKHQEEVFLPGGIYEPMKRYLILSITFQRTHCRVPAGCPSL